MLHPRKSEFTIRLQYSRTRKHTQTHKHQRKLVQVCESESLISSETIQHADTATRTSQTAITVENEPTRIASPPSKSESNVYIQYSRTHSHTHTTCSLTHPPTHARQYQYATRSHSPAVMRFSTRHRDYHKDITHSDNNQT